MSVIIKLEDENGVSEAELDEWGMLISLIVRSDQSESGVPRLIDYIDPYGNTVFNRLQMPQLRSEIEQLRAFAVNEKEHQLLIDFLDLIDQCESQTHYYIKTYGD